MGKIKLIGEIVDNDTAMIYRWLGFDAICPRMVENVAKSLGEDEMLEIDLNSPGGYCSAGAEIYTILRQISEAGHTVVVNVVGQACSAATVLMCGADTVNASPVSYFMFHNASASAYGKARDLRSATECLEQVDETIVNAYQEKTGHTREELHKLIDDETWMSANRAQEYGFVDNILFVVNLKQETEEDKEEDEMLDMVKACAISHTLIPEEKVALLKEFIIQDQKVKDVKDVEAKEPLHKKISNEGGRKSMTLQEACEQYPEINDELDTFVKNTKELHDEKEAKAVEDAVKKERRRMQDIENIEGAVSAEMAYDAKYVNPCDAKELAYRALTKHKNQTAKYMDDVMSDHSESNVADIKPEPDGEKNTEADELAGYVNAKHSKQGGKSNGKSI